MNWKRYWNKIAKLNAGSSAGQVQRNEQENAMLTVNHICKQLDVKQTDTVLDVCCGNGMITLEVAKKCLEIIGTDHSVSLLKIADKNNPKTNCTFEFASADELSNAVNNKIFDKIYLQFSFQYFDKRNQGLLVVKEMLKCLKPGGKIFIGDITNRSKLNIFLGSPKRKLKFHINTLRGKNTMGKFWKVSELDAICDDLKVKGAYLKQPSELPYAYYRFDYLIESSL